MIIQIHFRLEINDFLAEHGRNTGISEGTFAVTVIKRGHNMIEFKTKSNAGRTKGDGECTK